MRSKINVFIFKFTAKKKKKQQQQQLLLLALYSFLFGQTVARQRVSNSKQNKPKSPEYYFDLRPFPNVLIVKKILI